MLLFLLTMLGLSDHKVRRSNLINRFLPIYTYWNPFKFTIAITTYCNLKCSMCPRISRNIQNMHMSENVFWQASRYFKGRPLNILGIGEPFMHPKIFNFIRICQLVKSPLHITTNGMLLSENIIEELLEYPIVKEIAFSIDGLPRNYDELRINGNFQTVANNLKKFSNMRKSNLLLTVNFVGMKSNIDDLPMLIDYLADYVDKFHVIHPVANSNSVAAGHLHLHSTYAQKIFDESIHIAKKHKVILSLPSLYPESCKCIYPWTIPSIGINGDVYPCHMLSEVFQDKYNLVTQFYENFSFSNDMHYCMGNVNNGEIFWNGEIVQSLRKQLRKVNISKSDSYLEILKSSPKFYCKICPNRWEAAC